MDHIGDMVSLANGRQVLLGVFEVVKGSLMDSGGAMLELI